MADVKISALPAATTPLAGTEVLPIVQSSTTKKVAISDVTAGRAISASSLTLTTPLSVANGGTGLTSLTAGYIPFGAGTSAFGNDANLFWDNTNKYLGVGITVPTAPIDITGGAGTAKTVILIRSLAGNSNGFRIVTNSSTDDIYFNNYYTANMLFGTANTERMRIASDGSVGIGTASPSGILHTYATNGVNWFESPGVSSVSLQFKTNSSNRFRIGIPSASADLAFWSDAGSTEVMRLDASGNLGIGETSPSAYGKLTVNSGATAVSAYLKSTDTTAYSATSYNGGSARLSIIGGNATNAMNVIRFANSISNEFIFGTVQNAGGTGDFIWQAFNGSAYAELARITSSGNVVINTAAIATTATDGFLYVPTCAGTPTGTPTTYTGRAPIVVDTTNNKLYFYSGGAWRDAGP